MSRLDLVLDYYRACNAAEADGITATMTTDFVHYFLAPNRGSRPRRSPAELAATTVKSVALLGSQWTVERYLEQGDRAVIEYAMHWIPVDTAMPTTMRGCEWYELEGARMAEIRSYHQVTATVSDLDGFDYDVRGYGGSAVAVTDPAPEKSRISTILAYYDACTRGDSGTLQAMFAEDVVHYFLQPNVGSTPVGGAEHLARYWRKVARMLRARWVVESILEQGDEAVIEWSMYWELEAGGRRIVTRGTEWYVFDGELISEIRSYHKQVREDSGLDGFDYGAAGYSTHGRESSRLHEAAATPLSDPPD